MAGAMAAFVKWVAGQYAELQQSLRNRVLQIRRQGGGGWGHARTPAALAELQGGWEMFLQFALEVGALSGAEKKQLERRCERALAELGSVQAKYQAGSDPALRFLALVQAALAGGQAHVADRRVRCRPRQPPGAGAVPVRKVDIGPHAADGKIPSDSDQPSELAA